jgi:hypothetical protein
MPGEFLPTSDPCLFAGRCAEVKSGESGDGREGRFGALYGKFLCALMEEWKKIKNKVHKIMNRWFASGKYIPYG